MALITGVMDFTALNGKITTLIYENPDQEVSGTDMQETLVELAKACAPTGIRCMNTITTADIGKALGFLGEDAYPNLYQRTPASAGTNGQISIEFNALTPDWSGNEGVVIKEFDEQPEPNEIFESYVNIRGSVQTKFVSNLTGTKGKLKVEATSLPTFPNGAKYEILFTDNFEVGDKFKISVTGMAGIETNHFVASDTTNAGFYFLIGATLSDSIDNLLFRLDSFSGFHYGFQWTFEKTATDKITLENNNYKWYNGSTWNYILPESYNGYEAYLGMYDAGDAPIATVTQTQTAVNGNILPAAINALNGSVPTDNYFANVQIANGNIIEEIATTALLNDFSSIGIALGNYGISVPLNELQFNKILNHIIDNNSSSLFNITDDGYGTGDAWFEIEEKEIQTTGSGTPIQWSSNFLGFTSGWFDITVITESQVLPTGHDTLVFVEIGADLDETCANTAAAMSDFENAHGGAVYWEQVLAEPTKLKSRTTGTSGNPDPSSWYIQGSFFTNTTEEHFAGWSPIRSGEISMSLNNGQYSSEQLLNFDWLDWEDLPATKEDEAVMFRNMINSGVPLTGWVAVIDGSNAAKVNLTTSVPRIDSNNVSISLGDNTLYTSIPTVNVITQGDTATPESSNGFCIGTIQGVIERGGNKYAILTSSKIKKGYLKPNNPITGFDGSNLLVAGNDGFLKSWEFGIDSSAAYVGIAFSNYADVGTPTEIEYIDMTPTFLLGG